jgi:hypothetical protein
MGFTQNRIRAGSLASTMMTRHSDNGGVQSGGYVAVFQNMGAKGMGVVGSLLTTLFGDGVVLSVALMRNYQVCTSCRRRRI